ncbi:MAG: hypothetical protein CMH26_04775 [Micavibrio sp.]|nr:hypothetical protein [Micavibrio sp.]|tara:strand:+ start:291 stop:833 length:543 start_codon:yes stop_codon:yes gene_type:complete
MSSTHYNQELKRRAKFIKPPNKLKQKVGSGGLSEEILQKAQELLEHNTVEFEPLANIYLKNLSYGIESAKSYSTIDDVDHTLSFMIYPAMQLKANGGMFHYPLITGVADRLVQFLEVIEEPDVAALEIILAFHTTMRAIIQGKIKGSGGHHGEELISALDKACTRYFDKITPPVIEFEDI